MNRANKYSFLIAVIALAFMAGGCPRENVEVSPPTPPPISGDRVPSTAVLNQLARESLLALDTSVRTGDFQYLYDLASSELAREFTPEDLKRAFSDFIEKDIDLSALRHADPVFKAKAFIDSRGRLNMKGRFLIRPTPVDFELKHAFEQARWKLYAIKVNTLGDDQAPPPSKTPPMPDREQMKRMAGKSLRSLARAINTGNFVPFYNGIAKAWQQQTSPEELKRAFIEFVDNPKMNVMVAAMNDPVFNVEPFIDHKGILRLMGALTAPDQTVLFKLGYVAEDGEWKLAFVKLAA